MAKIKKTKILLWVLAILLLAIYIYVYVSNPLHKDYNIGIFGLIYALSISVIQLLFRKNKFRKEIAFLISPILLLAIYFVFL